MKQLKKRFSLYCCLLAALCCISLSGCSNDDKEEVTEITRQQYIDSTLADTSGKLTDYSTYIEFDEDLQEWIIIPEGVERPSTNARCYMVINNQYSIYNQKQVKVTGNYEYAYSFKYENIVTSRDLIINPVFHVFKLTITDIEEVK